MAGKVLFMLRDKPGAGCNGCRACTPWQITRLCMTLISQLMLLTNSR